MRNLYMYYKRLKQYIDKREKIESQQRIAGGNSANQSSDQRQSANPDSNSSKTGETAGSMQTQQPQSTS